ncbi:fibronectin type III domain-containing protein [Gorillibacterium sp. sgz5001074]|uniref:fibronectin type III domain-containing protein n=1 Tax=Gorillibacterium sp. sgz5001074 TaxID=3446695 RepID=UPI003F67855B
MKAVWWSTRSAKRLKASVMYLMVMLMLLPSGVVQAMGEEDSSDASLVTPFQSQVTVSPERVNPGQKVAFQAEVQSLVTRRVGIHLEVLNEKGDPVYQSPVIERRLKTMSLESFGQEWTVPANLAAGSYPVQLIIEKDGGGTVLHRNAEAALLQVGAGGVTVEASVRPKSVKGKETASIHVTAASTVARTSLVEVQVRSPLGMLVAEKQFPDTVLAAGTPTGLDMSWTVPDSIPGGSYTVDVTVYSADRKDMLARKNRAATVTVREGLGWGGPVDWRTRYTTSAVTVPAKAERGQTVRVDAKVKSTGNVTALIQIGVYDPSGDKVAEKVLDYQMLKAGVESVYPVYWSAPENAELGTYTVRMGLYRAGWLKLLYHLDWNAGTFTVVKASDPPPPDETPPAVPGGLKAVPGDGQVELAWNPVKDADLNGYKVYVTENGGATWASPVDAGNGTSYLVTGLTNGTLYGFTVTAYDKTGNESARSAVAEAKPQASSSDHTPPAVPVNVQIYPDMQPENVVVVWTAGTDPDLAGHKIYTSTDGGATWNAPLVSVGPAPFYKLAGLNPQVVTTIAVTAYDQSGNESAKSATVTYGSPPDTVPPAVPAGLKAVPGDGQVSLSWTPVSDGDLMTYTVYISEDQGSSWVKAYPGATASYIHSGAVNGRTYRYAVTATDRSQNESAKSETVEGTPQADLPPAAPTGVTAIPGNGYVKVSWPANPETDIMGYNVYVSSDGGNYWGDIFDVGPEREYTVSNLTNGQPYTFAVSAYDTAGHHSGLSERVNATPVEVDTEPPTAPAGLKALAGDNRVKLRWTVTAEPDVTGYRVYTSTDGGGNWDAGVAAGSKPAYTAINLDNGASYTFAVTAVDSSGNESGRSGAVTAVPKEPVVPEDPAVSAPALPATGAVSFADAQSFLYTGSQPVQTGVEPGTLEPVRLAVLQGYVSDDAGAPLAGVTVSILNRDEYGYTMTRADGRFDLAVNGGESLSVVYEKDGYIPVQRKVEAPWSDFTQVPDVLLKPFDTKVTEIGLSGATEVQAAQGSPVSDLDGQRQAAVLFEPGTSASLKLPSGELVPIETLHVRATEFTVGEKGREAMPGDLPQNVGYTYALELSVDEAVAAGAASVEFSQPVSFYVENFLEMPVGEIVPMGYFDRQAGQWVGSRNGKVIGLLSEAGGLAEIDGDGDGAADTAEQLASLGVTEQERRKLAELYEPGQSLWRVEVTHFTPYDCNWPYVPPDDAIDPPNQKPKGSFFQDPCEMMGSIIGCQEQTLGQAIPIAGTGMNLYYNSKREIGYTNKPTITIPVTGPDALPASIQGVTATVRVAGKSYTQSFPAVPNRVWKFVWDGKDAYGRQMTGSLPYTVVISYQYKLQLLSASTGGGGDFDSSWGRVGRTGGGGMAFVIAERNNMNMSTNRIWNGMVESAANPFREMGIAGWSLEDHHYYDGSSDTLYLGTGGVDRRNTLNARKVHYRGDAAVPGSEVLPDHTSVIFDYDYRAAYGPDGSIYYGAYVSQKQGAEIYRLDKEGVLTKFADAPMGTSAHPLGLTVGSDGTVYGFFHHSTSAGVGIYNLFKKSPSDPDWIKIAGSERQRSRWEVIPDGTPALEADFYHPMSTVLAPDGSIYFVDEWRMYRLQPDGNIVTMGSKVTKVEGNVGADSGIAYADTLGFVEDIAIGSDGTIYVLDSGGSHCYSNHCPESRIRKIAPDGTMTKVAGGPFSAQNQPAPPKLVHGMIATEGTFRAKEITLDYAGNLYVFDLDRYSLLKIVPNGYVEQIASEQINKILTSIKAEGGDYQGTIFSDLIAGSSNGDLLLRFSNYKRKPDSYDLYAFKAGGRSLVADDNGRTVYRFDPVSGRQLQTLNGYNGHVMAEYGYDPDGRLLTIKDTYGNTVQVERDASGTPTAIIAPGGQRTVLTVEGGQLKAVSNSAGETYRISYKPTGLLETFTDPMDQTSQYGYDDAGFLVKAVNPELGEKTLVRTEHLNGYDVVYTDPDGRATKYEVTVDEMSLTRKSIAPGGAVTTAKYDTSGGSELLYPDGTRVTRKLKPDPRWGWDAPMIDQLTYVTPDGRTVTASEKRTAVLANERDPFSLQSLTIENQANGAVMTSHYDVAAGTITSTSAESVTSTVYLNGQGKVAQAIEPGIAPVVYQYDEKGRLQKTEQGDQFVVYAYDDRNRLESKTDSTGVQKRYTYDGADRVKTITSPGTKVYEKSYDKNGNTTGVKLPDGSEYVQGYNKLGQFDSFSKAGSAELVALEHTTGGMLDATHLAGGRVIDYGYEVDGAHRINAMNDADFLRSYEYLDQTDRVRKITSTRQDEPELNQTIEYQYDGMDVRSMTFTGRAAGTFGYQYDPFSNLTNITTRITAASPATVSGSVYGASTVTGAVYSTTRETALVWDKDQHLTKFGPFDLIRNGPNKRIGTIQDGTMNVGVGYDSMGRVESLTYTVGDKEIYRVHNLYDKRGLVSDQTIVSPEGTESVHYVYDDDGQLKNVMRSGVPGSEYTEGYDYDANKNRKWREVSGHVAEAAEYDANGLLKKVGNVEYRFDADGFLTHKGSQTFQYGAKGELLEATTVTGSTYRYTYDGINRRTARDSGTGTVQYLYGNPMDVWMLTDAVDEQGVVTQYHYNENGLLLALEREGVRYYVITDSVGTPLRVVDAEGRVVKQLRYDSYGALLHDSNPGFRLDIGFAGGLADDASGLVRFGFRDYDPVSGRWTARDPILFDSQQGNLYAYVNNNPTTWRDPCGLLCVGGSAYEGIGFGAKVCITPEGVSGCLEAGVGVGGGIDVSPFEDLADDSVEFELSVKAGIGPLSISSGGKVKITGDGDCKSEWTLKGDAGPARLDLMDLSKSQIKGKPEDLMKDWDHASKKDINLKGFKAEAVAKVKGCKQYKW